MRRPATVWAGALGALSLLDLWADRNSTTGDSLSEVLRGWFRTDTTAGKCALAAFWACLTAWLLPHLFRQPNRPTR